MSHIINNLILLLFVNFVSLSSRDRSLRILGNTYDYFHNGAFELCFFFLMDPMNSMKFYWKLNRCRGGITLIQKYTTHKTPTNPKLKQLLYWACDVLAYLNNLFSVYLAVSLSTDKHLKAPLTLIANRKMLFYELKSFDLAKHGK